MYTLLFDLDSSMTLVFDQKSSEMFAASSHEKLGRQENCNWAEIHPKFPDNIKPKRDNDLSLKQSKTQVFHHS